MDATGPDGARHGVGRTTEYDPATAGTLSMHPVYPYHGVKSSRFSLLRWAKKLFQVMHAARRCRGPLAPFAIGLVLLRKAARLHPRTRWRPHHRTMAVALSHVASITSIWAVVVAAGLLARLAGARPVERGGGGGWAGIERGG